MQKAAVPPPRPREDPLSQAQISSVRQFRATTRLPVIVAGNETYFTKNLSMGGLFLLTPRRWAVGTTHEIRVRFDEQAHVVSARVTHVQADGVGLSFVDPEESLRDALRGVLDAHIDPLELAAFGSLTQTMYRQLTERMRIGWSIDGMNYEAALSQLSPEGLVLESEAVPAADVSIYVHIPAVVFGKAQVLATEVRGCEARVMYRDSEKFGAKFVNASAEFRMAVNALLAK